MNQPMWALDTNGLWHLYADGRLAMCGYKTDGGMVGGPRPDPPNDEAVCGLCNNLAPKFEVRQCNSCNYETQCKEIDLPTRHGEAPSGTEWLCDLCGNTPRPQGWQACDVKQTTCYVGNAILAEIKRLGLQPRGSYR